MKKGLKPRAQLKTNCNDSGWRSLGPELRQWKEFTKIPKIH